MVSQTFTPSTFMVLPNKKALLTEYGGKPLSSIRTPAIVIDVTTFKKNAQVMKDRAEAAGALFRAHVKSHKTAEGTEIQLQTNPPTQAVICSTLPEAWGIVNAGLTGNGSVKDILYGFPLPLDKIEDLRKLQDRVEHVTVMIDSVLQVRGLSKYVKQSGQQAHFRAFIKIDQGGSRAGLVPESSDLKPLIAEVLASPHLTLHGMYCHAGDAYASRDGETAANYLRIEIEALEKAAVEAHNVVKEKGLSPLQLVLSLGSTPTAHASTVLANGSTLSISGGQLEVHAGVYPLCDLQQQATGLASEETLSLGVVARVCSTYPDRPTPQALIDAGAIAFSKDTGPSGDFGQVYGRSPLHGWRVSKISQEHGILSPPEGMHAEDARTFLRDHGEALMGSLLTIRPQHACLTCAAHPWYYIVNGPDEDIVRDIWIPWKGW